MTRAAGEAPSSCTLSVLAPLTWRHTPHARSLRCSVRMGCFSVGTWSSTRVYRAEPSQRCRGRGLLTRAMAALSWLGSKTATCTSLTPRACRTSTRRATRPRTCAAWRPPPPGTASRSQTAGSTSCYTHCCRTRTGSAGSTSARARSTTLRLWGCSLVSRRPVRRAFFHSVPTGAWQSTTWSAAAPQLAWSWADTPTFHRLRYQARSHLLRRFHTLLPTQPTRCSCCAMTSTR
mmetsp:Transcript_22660/g.67494  ORF Transcript_22660/g.67494 Transcript_22660/m.67494 type:complete len:233 (-) Transcript_22660:1096-1794(-)